MPEIGVGDTVKIVDPGAYGDGEWGVVQAVRSEAPVYRVSIERLGAVRYYCRGHLELVFGLGGSECVQEARIAVLEESAQTLAAEAHAKIDAFAELGERIAALEKEVAHLADLAHVPAHYYYPLPDTITGDSGEPPPNAMYRQVADE